MGKVLVVEDSLTDYTIINEHLQELGMQVSWVQDCPSAQERIRRGSPDLILLDIMLPGQSGFEFCRELKSDPQTRDIPIILCSTKGTEADKLLGRMSKADAYLAKPLDPGMLIMTVRQLIARYLVN